MSKPKEALEAQLLEEARQRGVPPAAIVAERRINKILISPEFRAELNEVLERPAKATDTHPSKSGQHPQ